MATDPLAPAPPAGPKRGRGATFNPDNRFRDATRVAVDDGWAREPDPEIGEETSRQVRTTVTIQLARTIITRNRSPDIPFDASINPYQGCEHGCIYCYARPTHAYLDLSPGLDFETKLFAKPDAPKLLREELAKPGYVCDPIALGTNTDPYQPIEREWKITRQLLEVLAEHEHPFSIVTKNALIERDLDIIAPMAAKRMARAYLSIIPQLNDRDLEAILEAAAEAGAQGAGWIMLRLPLEVAPLFRDWLATHYPDRAPHVMSLVRDLRGGKDYDANWGTRMRGTGAYASIIEKRFEVACRRFGLNEEGARVKLDASKFRPPARDGGRQGML